MRLTCPNCGAQYEVPDEVIPPEGRDVQCSNCGNTWYQAHADDLETLDVEPETEAELDPPQEVPEPVEAEPETEAASDAAEAEDDEPDTGDDEPEPDAPAEPARREIDPAVSEILRQEAEHEARIRAGKTGGLESQPDLGLDDLPEDEDRRARESRERMARMRGEEPATAQEIDPATGADSRRDLFPNIEEINSTLRTGEDGGAAASATGTDTPEPRRSGFARGFMLSLLLVVILVLIYANAPAISQAVPAVDPALNAYVTGVDGLRIWLDGLIGGMVPTE